MGLVENYLEIEKSYNQVREQLYDKICFIHKHIGKDYRADDYYFDSGDDIIEIVEKDGFVTVYYEYFRNELGYAKIVIKTELLDMPEDEILKNKDNLKTELDAYNEEQLRQLKEIKKEKELETKKRECERLMAQVQKLESEIGK